MNVDVRHLKLVYHVAHEGSLTKAARYLHLTQPALSHQLKDLEGLIGTPVFNRVGKTMTLTAAGRRLLETAQHVLEVLAETEADIQRIATGQTGTIRISTACYTCYHWLPRIIERFQVDFPDVTIDIDVAATRQPLPALLAGAIDLAIVSAPAANPKLTYTPLFEDEKVALVRPDHPFAERAYLTPTDFVNEHVIVYNGETSSVVRTFLEPAGIQPRRLSEMQITEGILGMVKAGLGITVLARWAALPDLQAGRLVAVSLTEAGLPRQWSAARLDCNSTPAYLHRFIDLLVEEAAPALAARVVVN